MSAAAVKVQFNAHFKPVNRSKRRYRALRGSAGSGKSVNIAQDYTRRGNRRCGEYHA